MKSEERGLVILYTGKGKGKTTAALGLVLRAAGYDKSCLVIQFAKSWFSGELMGIKKLGPKVKIIQGGKGFVGILGDRLDKKIHQQAAQKTYQLLYKQTLSGKWEVVVADEILGAIAGGLIKLSQAITLIKNKPHRVNLVLTGRQADQKLIRLADLVTEMKEIKHPYQKGILARKGVDF